MGKSKKLLDLYIPKDKINGQTLRGVLTFDETCLVKETKDFYIVPRETFRSSELKDLGIEYEEHNLKYKRINLSPKRGFSLLSHQEDAWEALKNIGSGGVLNLACGKGKTIMGLYLAAHLKVPTLIVSSQRAHLENWEAELKTFFRGRYSIGWVQGKTMDWDKDIVFATVQTLAKKKDVLPPEFSDHFGLAIYDECHCMAAEMFSKAANLVSGVRLGLSATPNRTDQKEGIFIAHLGKVLFKDLEQDLIPTLKVIRTALKIDAKDEKQLKDRSGMYNLMKIRSYLATHFNRNEIIKQKIDKCLEEGRTVYVLSHIVEHVSILHGYYPNSQLITGKTKSTERLQKLNTGNLIFATMGVGKEAYNRKDLDTLFLITPFAAHKHAAIEFDQSVGRIQRNHPTKKDPEVYLFMDNISFCFALCQSLITHAEKKGFPIEGAPKRKRRRKL